MSRGLGDSTGEVLHGFGQYALNGQVDYTSGYAGGETLQWIPEGQGYTLYFSLNEAGFLRMVADLMDADPQLARRFFQEIALKTGAAVSSSAASSPVEEVRLKNGEMVPRAIVDVVNLAVENLFDTGKVTALEELVSIARDREYVVRDDQVRKDLAGLVNLSSGKIINEVYRSVISAGVEGKGLDMIWTSPIAGSSPATTGSSPAIATHVSDEIKGRVMKIIEQARSLPVAGVGVPDIQFHSNIDVNASHESVRDGLSRLLNAIEQNQLLARKSGHEPMGYGQAINEIRPLLAEFQQLTGSSPAALEGQSPAGTVPAPTGGIDFRQMEIITKPMGSFLGLNFSLPKVSNAEAIDLDNEFNQIKKMVDSRIVPSGERVKEFVAACYQRNELGERRDDIISCCTEILKIEEEGVSNTANGLKEVLVILDSGLV